MKVIVTKDSIVSLENVRRVDMKSIESTHSTYGKKYIVTDCYLNIHYNDNTSERIDCDVDDKGKAMMLELFNKIIDILKEE